MYDASEPIGLDWIEGSVATRLRCGGMFDVNFIAKFTTQSVGEKIFKMGQHFCVQKAMSSQ